MFRKIGSGELLTKKGLNSGKKIEFEMKVSLIFILLFGRSEGKILRDQIQILVMGQNSPSGIAAMVSTNRRAKMPLADNSAQLDTFLIF